MASLRRRHSDEEWLRHRTSIRRMFLNENKSFGYIIQKLGEDDFPVTKSQLEYKLKAWGFRKKTPKTKSESIWQFVDERITLREEHGKCSEVILEGKVVEPAKVSKERRRYQRSSLATYQQEPLNAQTPQGLGAMVSICTPASLPLKFSWPKSLPWLQFQSGYPELFQTDKKPGLGSQLSDFAGDLKRWGIALKPTPSVALLAARFGSMVPEAEEGANTRLAQTIVSAPAQLAVNECHKLVIYQLSNNMLKGHMWYYDPRNWTRIVNVIENSGIMSSELAIGEAAGPTINAFVEKLFQMTWRMMIDTISGPKRPRKVLQSPAGFSVMERAKKVVRWMLSSGQDPNIQIRLEDGASFTPLRLALEMLEAQLAIQLLDAGADPKYSYTGFGDVLHQLRSSLSRCENVLDPKMMEVFHRFADTGLCPDDISDHGRPSALMMAVSMEILPLADILIRSGASLFHTSYRFQRKATVLGYAGGISQENKAMEFILFLLEHAQAICPLIPRAEFIKEDVVMNIALNGHLSVLEFLHDEIGYDVSGVESEGITALHIAAAAGNYDVCVRLLAYNALVDGPDLPNKPPSPLMLAAFGMKKDIVQLLHRHGANIDSTFAINDNLRSWLYQFWGDSSRWQNLFDVRYQGDCSINPAGAAIIGYPWNNAAYVYLAEQGAKLPEWAVYHGARDTHRYGLVEAALKENVNVNWLGSDQKTPLQVVLSSTRIWPLFSRRLWPISSSLEGVNPIDYVDQNTIRRVDLCFKLLNAGAILKGDEAQLAILLNDWSLVEEILRIDSPDISQRNSTMSLMEAAFLSGSDNMVHHVFKSNPESYDDGALCAAVLFATRYKSTIWLQRFLQNRPKSEGPSLLEGTAVGLAAWGAETEVLRSLCLKFGRPLVAGHPRMAYFPCDEIKIDLFCSLSGRPKPPFWRRKNLDIVDPLLFILESPKWAPKLQELGCYSVKQLSDVAVNLESEEVLEFRLTPQRPSINREIPKQQGDQLLSAIEYNRVEAAKALIDEGEDVNKSDYIGNWQGRSPLQQAVDFGNLNMIDILLKAGAEVNAPAARDSGATALQLAAIRGRIGIAKMLIDFGADVNAHRAEKRGRTALEGAAEHGRIDMVHFLLREEAETGGRGRLQYMRAIKFAEREGHLVAANMLREHRDWTADDDDLWSRLESHAQDWEEKLEDFFFDQGEYIEFEED